MKYLERKWQTLKVTESGVRMKTYEFDMNAIVNNYSFKKEKPLLKMIMLGILAGAFVAIGAASSNMATHAITNVGLAKTLAGCIFPVGLIMIVFIGGELFTGDCMMVFGTLDRRYSFLSIFPTLAVVYLSNLIGGLIIAMLVSTSGQFHYTEGLLGAYTIKVACGKVGLHFWEAFSSGILCNILVCVAVLMAAAAKDITGKIALIFFPIFVFVIGGYEHCVANMYYISAGIFASFNPVYTQKAMDTYGITSAQIESLKSMDILTHNLIPVTLGNIVGGMLFVTIPLYVIYKSRIIKNSDKPDIIKVS